MTRPLLKYNKNWKIINLEEDPENGFINYVTSGSTPSTKNHDFWGGTNLWLTPKEVTDKNTFRYISNTERTITESGLRTCSAKILTPNSVLLTKRAPVGKVVMNKLPMATNQGFLNFTCGKNLLHEFLYYWFKANTPYLEIVANGSTYSELYLDNLFEFKIAVPEIEVQKQITKILSTLDEKIELNRIIINNLEQIIASIFKKYILDIVQKDSNGNSSNQLPNGWKYCTIAELEKQNIIISLQDGNHGEQHPKTIDFSTTGIPFILAKDLVGDNLDLVNCNLLKKEIAENLRIGFANPGDVLLTHKGTVGRTDIVPEGHDYIVLSPQVTYYRLNEKTFSNIFLKYSFQSEYFQSQLATISEQTTREYVSLTTQRELKILLPPKEKIKEFHEMSKSIYEKINLHQIQSNILKDIKFLLLPKLISGNVDISKLKNITSHLFKNSNGGNDD